jgi:hypothetical protein
MAGEKVNAQGTNEVITCGNWVMPTVSATATVVVTGVAGKRINVCGYYATSSATGTIQFSYSSIAALCTTSTTVLSPVLDLNANKDAKDHQAGAFVSTPNSMSLCAVPSATTVKYIVYYSQD